MAGKAKKGGRDMAFVVGSFVPGEDGPTFTGPYPINQDLVTDPLFTEFAKAACPFMMPGPYPQDHELAVKTGYRMKETGNKSFHDGDYELAASKYRYAIQLFQFVVKTYPYVATEVVLLNSNLSASHCKLGEYDKALEHANICIELDHHFIKGFYRRAEAYNGLADEAKAAGKDSHSLYFDALKDYCKCYRKMLNDKDKNSRLKQYCEALIIAVDLGTTKNLPEFHDDDKDSIVSFLIVYLVSSYPSKKIEKALNFLLFTHPNVEKSGMAEHYPCDLSNLSVSVVYSKKVLTEPIFNALVSHKMTVKPSDLIQFVSTMNPNEEELAIFQRLVAVVRDQPNGQGSLVETLDNALLYNNTKVSLLLLAEGISPSRSSAVVAFDLLRALPNLFYRVISCCTPDVRASFAAKCIAARNAGMLQPILESGPLVSNHIDLSGVVCSSLLNENHNHIAKFISTGAPPNGMVGSTAPIAAVFRSNDLTRVTQVKIVIILIEGGASIKNLSSAYSDPMSPVHVATKLVLETGIIKILEVVCSRFEFPSNGRLVDKHNRTPLHLVMIAEPSVVNLEALEQLVKFNIDKSIKDDHGKKAEDYAQPQLDNKRKSLVAVPVPKPAIEKKHKEASKPRDKFEERLAMRREMFKEELDDCDEEELESWRRWESRFERMPKLMRMSLGKKAGPWGCDMSIFPCNTTFEEALKSAREQKERGNALFSEKKYSEALSTYGKSHMKYDWICANFPRKIHRIKDDIKVLVCNMALGYHRSAVPEASVECCNDAIDIDPTYYKAYYRRAEAYKYIAQERTHPTKPTYSFDCFCSAVKDYARAYTFCTTPEDVSKRSEWFFECLIIAVDVGHTELLPNIHECDKPVILTKVVENLTKHDKSYYSKELVVYLDFILLKTSRLPNAGVAHLYPCSCAAVSVSSLLPNLSIDLLKSVLSHGCVLSSDDIVESVKCLKKSQSQLIKFMLETYLKDSADDDKSSLTSICNEIVDSKKLHFVSLLVKNGAKPSAEKILEYADFSKLDTVLTEYVASSCTPSSRTKLFCAILQSGGTKEAVETTLRSGPLVIENIDLTSIIASNLLLHHTEILRELVATVAPTSGTLVVPSATPALSILFLSKCPSRLQQMQLTESLIRLGADIKLLSNIHSESISPLHIATKLALETGHAELVQAVCARFPFDGQNKVIDKNTQTPFHYALRAKHNDSTVKVCEYLSEYPIDPLIKDRWGKTAQEYGRSKGDKRVPYLHKAGALTGHRMKGTNDNQPSSALPQQQQQQQHEQKASKKKNKKKKKGKLDEKQQTATQDEENEENLDENEDSARETALPQEVPPETVSTPTTAEVSIPTQPACPNLATLLSYLSQKGREYFKPSSNYLVVCVGETPASDALESTLPSLSELVPKGENLRAIGRATVDPDFDSLPWEVECTDRILQFLKDPQYPHLVKTAIINRLHTLATGRWSDGGTLALPVTTGDGPTLYETRLSSTSFIVWEVAVQFSSRCTDEGEWAAATAQKMEREHVYSEVIRVWDIVTDEEKKALCIRQIQKSHTRGLKSHLCFTLVPRATGRHHVSRSSPTFPRCFVLSTSDNPMCDLSSVVVYVPAAQSEDSDFNVVMFYALTSSLVRGVVTGTHPRRYFPFKEWPVEHDIVRLPMNSEAVLLLGRSGTGKTTCCLYRLWAHFLTYWQEAAVVGACHPRRPLPLTSNQMAVELKDVVMAEEISCIDESLSDGNIDDEDEQSTATEELEDLHQVFLTKNYLLSSQMKKKFYDMAASHECFADHMTYETASCPLDLSSVHSKAFPLFLTSRQFLILLDGSLEGKPFFPRNKDGSLAVKISSSDYNREDPNTLLDLDASDDEDGDPNEGVANPGGAGIKSHSQQVWREVTASYFVSEIWPKIVHHSGDKSIDPLLVWIEIKSFIKGSLLAVGKPDGALSLWEYEAIGRKVAANFVGNRTEIYNLFEQYRNYVQRKRNLNLFDENDLICHLYQRVVKHNGDFPWSIHHFFIDEVQDFTQAELALILHICREPNGLFLTGDTAQSIMRGISFRFRDIRSLFHLASKNSPPSSRIVVPRVHELLINFRSHSGILQLASSIIELLKEYFPSSFDRLPEDRGMFPGPLPVFLKSCQVSDLALLLRSNKRVSSSIEFGAHQVIIVQSEEAKSSLPEVLKSGIVLTVFEAKGLEFDDVLLYNFFTDSPISKEWRIVTTYADKSSPPSDLKVRPRPLNFNERFHKSLNSELKYLYTAITRAKCNLWIYDSSEACRLPMFDYWVRRGLIRVVSVGEKEDDGILFTATSTVEQWDHQGDYFFKKGLWEPAMKCYRRSGNLYSEKEAEAYLYVQRARQSRVQREVDELFEKAAQAFLSCDYVSHNVRHVTNGAKCLKNARKYLEAAKLYERLGQDDLAKRCYFRAKDHVSMSRISEAEGDYSGAVRIFVQANRRMEALEKAHQYEKKGHRLETDVASLQLANTYAKYYLAHHEESSLVKVLQYIPNVALRVAHLKKGKMFKLAVEEYIKAKHHKDAERLMIAQEMFDEGIKFAVSLENKSLELRFVLFKVTAAIYRKGKLSEELIESLAGLTKCSSLSIQAKALLLSGFIHSKPNQCRDAVKMYTDSCANGIGALEAFDQFVDLKKKDVPYSLVIVKCFEARDLAKVFRSTANTPTRTKAIQQMMEFYSLSKLDGNYLLSRSQDIWIRSLRTAVKDTDDNGMLVLDPIKVHALLVDRFNDFWNCWLVETEVEKQLLTRLSSFSFHREVIEHGYLTSHLQCYPSNLVKEYIGVVDAAIKTHQLSPGRFLRGVGVESLPLKIFSFRVSLCLPLSKSNCLQYRRSDTIRPILTKTLENITSTRALKQPNVDDLFKAWFCQSLIDDDHPNRFEEAIEAFAKKEGPPGHTKSWLVVDRHSKEAIYHHFFAFWLRACRLVRDDSQVIVAAKLVYNCFFSVIARRSTLRKTLSVINYVFPLSIFATALLGIVSVTEPQLGLCLPIFYRYQCQLFDVINIQGSQQYWLMSACVQIADEKKNDSKLLDDTTDLLYKMLQLLVGDYQQQFDLLKFSLSSESNAMEDGTALHCIVCVLVLIANLAILKPSKQDDLNRLLNHICLVFKEQLESPDSKSPSYLKTANEKIQSASTVGDLFSVVQFVYQSSNYPSGLARLQPAKSGNMDFKEMVLPPHVAGILIRIRPATPTPPTPNKEEKKVEPSLPLPPEVPPNEPVAPPLQQQQQAQAVATSQPQQQAPMDSVLQQQWVFVMQRLEELQQYQLIVEQQLSQIRLVPRHLLTLAQEQQHSYLTQQYQQITQAKQQYQLQLEHIQQQYQRTLMNMQIQAAPVPASRPSPELHSANSHILAPPTTLPAAPLQTQLGGGALSPRPQVVPSNREPEDDTDMIFDEEEIEKILGSFLSEAVEEPSQATATMHPLDEDYSLPGVDHELVDSHYCQICGISFARKRRSPLLDDLTVEEDEEVTPPMGVPEYKQHVQTQSHKDNLLAYNKFNAIKTGPYSLLRSKLNDTLAMGQGLLTVAEVAGLLLQINSELREFDEQLEECVNAYNWREAHSRLVGSLDVLQSHTSRLTRVCEQAYAMEQQLPHQKKSGLLGSMMMEGEREADVEVIEMAKEFASGREKALSKKKQKK